MKKLILGFILTIISTVVFCQSYACDSTARYKHIDDSTFVTTREETIINIKDGIISFVGVYNFTGRITDTLGRMFKDNMYSDIFKVTNIYDESDKRRMNIVYYYGFPQAIGILNKNQYSVFHVKNILTNGQPN